VFGTERLERFAFWDYGPELSRRFRALKIWMMLKHHGASVFAEAIEENLRMARRLEAKVRGTRRLELLNRSDLGIVCFRYVPPGPRLPEADLTRLNERVMVAIQRRGRAFVSNARVRGRFALRACIINYRTSEADLDALIAETLAAGAAVGVSDASDRVAASAGATVSTRSGRGRGSRGRRPSRPRSRSGAGRSR
jgi:glutamate/tyrosine decarboxylase-like PLP-dependent enzyme